MGDVRQWLDSLGLGQYAEVFEKNAIETEQVATLTHDELRELGVMALGHRKRIRDHPPLHPVASSAAPEHYTPAHLAARVLASRAAMEGERKQITVLFADVVGSTALIRALDAEGAMERLRPAVESMMAVVHRHEGLVNRVQGDGIMALFGAPIAHEDHAVRACLAALEIRDAVRDLADREIDVRIGLNSGEVVVRAIRSDLSVEYEADGVTVHHASRMEQLARPGTVRATETTARLAQGHIEWRPLGALPVKGACEPVPQVELLREVEASSRWEIRARRGLTRYIGREPEFGTLEQALALAAEGRGQLVAIVGEPGMGKSRLVHEFLSRGVAGKWTVRVTAASSYDKGTPFLPIRQLLHAIVGVKPGDGANTIAVRLDRFSQLLGPEFASVRLALRSLAGIPIEDEAWATLDPTQRRRATIDAFRALVLRQAEHSPLLLVFEDLHWLDAETQAALDALVESVPGVHLMLLTTYRPEYRDPWTARSCYRNIRLSALGQSTADALVRTLLGDDPSIEPLRPLVVEATEGRPLFVEETVRALAEEGQLEGGAGEYRLISPVDRLRIPDSVQAVLAARIDGLDPETKRVLQTAAVIGRQVPLGLLATVCELDHERLAPHLQRLQASEFLYEREVLPETRYAFKHALTESVAYQGLLRKRRVKLHAATLDAMRDLDSMALPDVEVLARHALEGERWSEAVDLFRKAVNRATAQSAHTAAWHHLERALEATAHLPRSHEAGAHAIDFHLDIKTVLLALGRLIEIGPHLDEAERMADTLGDRQRHSRVFYHLCQYHWLKGDHLRALEYGERAREVATAAGDTVAEAEILHRLGALHHSLGNYQRGVELLRRGEIFIEGRSDTPGLPLISTRLFLVWCLAELGEFDEAVRIAEDNYRSAQDARLPWSVVDAAMALGVAYVARGTPQQAIEPLEVGLSQCHEGEIPMMTPWVSRHLGTAYLRCARVTDGIALLEQDQLQSTRTGVFANLSLGATRLGEGYLRADRHADAASAARRALDLARAYAERGHEAGARWLLARIAASSDPPDRQAAQRHYLHALSLATELGMRPLMARCHRDMAAFLETAGKLPAASEHRQAADDLYRALGMSNA